MKKRKTNNTNAMPQASPAQLWPVAGLRPHPRQAELFDNLPESQFESLVASIHRDGIQVPIEALPDGTLVCGHQRVRAAMKLGLTNVPVIMRHDLAAMGEAAVLERMIADNVLRRQLDALSTARAYRAMKANRPGSVVGDLRDWLGQQFGCSGRSLDRVERLLDLPRAVQAAISNNSLSCDLATTLFSLDEAAREEVARRNWHGRARCGSSARACSKETQSASPRHRSHTCVRDVAGQH
jgi:ParB/RepB/Spo0J family partition protein